MNLSNKDFDKADELAQREREKGIEDAKKTLVNVGTDECIDCCEPIGSKRKKALPSARRCMACQNVIENKNNNMGGR